MSNQQETRVRGRVTRVSRERLGCSVKLPLMAAEGTLSVVGNSQKAISVKSTAAARHASGTKDLTGQRHLTYGASRLCTAQYLVSEAI